MWRWSFGGRGDFVMGIIDGRGGLGRACDGCAFAIRPMVDFDQSGGHPSNKFTGDRLTRRPTSPCELSPKSDALFHTELDFRGQFSVRSDTTSSIPLNTKLRPQAKIVSGHIGHGPRAGCHQTSHAIGKAGHRRQGMAFEGQHDEGG